MTSTPLTIAGQDRAAMQDTLLQRVTSKIASGAMPAHEQEYLRRLNLLPTKLEDGSVRSIDPAHIERLKNLCQLWDVQVRETSITSHRKVIGPVIVFVKRMVIRLVRLVLKDSMRQQRDFNAGVIALLSDICSKK
jgi:hypothetical protein